MIPIHLYKGKQVALFGLGKSGISAALALQAGGADVRAWDDQEPARKNAAARGVHVRELQRIDWSAQHAFVIAPGVPLTHPAPHPLVQAAQDAECPVIGDVELFAQARADLPPHGLVAITGTNGKSTTTALIAHIIAHAGGDALACGNIGTAVLDIEPLPRGGVYAMELSSYQLDLTQSLVADVAVLLNVTPDHLDRHGSMANYVGIKRRIFGGQRAEHLAVVGVDDSYGLDTYADLKAKGAQHLIPISGQTVLQQGVYVDGSVLMDATSGAPVPVIDLAHCLSLPGTHNGQNAAAAYAATRHMGLAPEVIAAALQDFPGLAHRAQRVGELDGVVFVNDSKATNAEAAEKALGSFKNIRWIAGGQAKAGGIDGLLDKLSAVQSAYLMGEAQEEFAKALDGKLPVARCGTLENAVFRAFSDSQPGDVILLSPACASFDQFPNFEARGDAFVAAMMDLKPGGAA